MANPWTTFQELITMSRRTIAQVISTNNTTERVFVQNVGSTDTIIVESNGSSYSDGSYVYIENNVIVGSAPSVRTSVTELIS